MVAYLWIYHAKAMPQCVLEMAIALGVTHYHDGKLLTRVLSELVRIQNSDGSARYKFECVHRKVDRGD